MHSVPGAGAVVVGDLSSIDQMRSIAQQVNALGTFNAVIHNVGIGYQEPKRIATKDGLPHVFAVNTLAPYVLTALIQKPERLVYMSSGLHEGGDPSLVDVTWETRQWDGFQAYSDSKLYDMLLALTIARRWPKVLSNAVEPGWVPTKMGGPAATDNLQQGHLTQAWLAVSNDAGAMVSGEYFYHLKRSEPLPAARNPELQDELIEICRKLSGIALPPQTSQA